MKIINGQLAEAQWVPSPNYSQRDEDEVSLLVIHNISLPPGQFGTGCVHQLFCNQLNPEDHEYFQAIADLKVSSHLLIERDGQLIQFVNFNDKAWHAGVSCYEGRANCNEYSIGIELEGTDNLPYTADQYQALHRVTLALLDAYPQLSIGRITGHEQIAPGRKTDPGPAFDWDGYLGLLKARQG
ncbi:MAG: 1,6-anhydro-N-acetylmuramyl-L-alanine amidase AmpD [Oceanobacter sp.]